MTNSSFRLWILL